MRNMVYCRSTAHNEHSFYLRSGNTDYYLFTQSFRRTVHDMFAGGVFIDKAIGSNRKLGNAAIRRTCEKIRKYIVYIEKEYDIEVLDKTVKKGCRRYSNAA